MSPLHLEYVCATLHALPIVLSNAPDPRKTAKRYVCCSSCSADSKRHRASPARETPTLPRCLALLNSRGAPGLVHTTQINVSVAVEKHSISSSWQTPPGHHRSAKVQQSSKHQYTCSWRVLISRRRLIIGCRGNCDHRRRMLITACAATRSQALQGMLGSQGSRLAIVC
jgi:hypothetical protein